MIRKRILKMNEEKEYEVDLCMPRNNNFDFASDLSESNLIDYIEITKDENGNDIMITYFDKYYHNFTTKDKAVHTSVSIIDINSESIQRLLKSNTTNTENEKTCLDDKDQIVSEEETTKSGVKDTDENGETQKVFEFLGERKEEQEIYDDEVELYISPNNDYDISKYYVKGKLGNYVEITKDENGNDIKIEYLDKYYNLTTKDKAVHTVINPIDVNDERIMDLLKPEATKTENETTCLNDKDQTAFEEETTRSSIKDTGKNELIQEVIEVIDEREEKKSSEYDKDVLEGEELQEAVDKCDEEKNITEIARNQTYYLNDDHQIVSKEEATRFIAKFTDENGQIQEVFGLIGKREEKKSIEDDEDILDGEELQKEIDELLHRQTYYFNDKDQIVPKEEATRFIIKDTDENGQIQEVFGVIDKGKEKASGGILKALKTRLARLRKGRSR